MLNQRRTGERTKELANLVLGATRTNQRLQTALRGPVSLSVKPDGIVTSSSASGMAPFQAQGARGVLLFDAVKEDAGWRFTSLSAEITEIVDRQTGSFRKTSRTVNVPETELKALNQMDRPNE